MSIDAEIHVLYVSDDDIARAIDFIDQVAWPAWDAEGEYIVQRWGAHAWLDTNGQRFWSPGYQRGHWPTIASCLMLAIGAFPDRLVTYDGDHVAIEDHQIVDDDFLRSYWQEYYASVWQDINNESDEQ